MNLFVIHSGADTPLVEQKIVELRRQAYDCNALVLQNGGRFWKREAKRKIKASQAVLFFLGETSHTSENIAWEIEEAKAQGKPIYTVPLVADATRHKALTAIDAFTDEAYQYDKVVTLPEVAAVIRGYEEGDYHIFNTSDEELDQKLLLEQYKLFLATSESVVDRRQGMNNFYITVNSTLLAFYGAILALSLDLLLKLAIGMLFSVVGIVLTFSWIRLLSSYGNLNGSKMKIISAIERKLPASLYDAEWAALSDRLNKKRYVSFSTSEKMTPRLFCMAYALLALCCAAAAVVQLFFL